MFARGNRTEKTADEAWEHLSHAWATAGETASRAGDRVTSVTDEALTRAGAAADALSGKRPARSWGLIAAVAVLGVAVGWAVASAARAALERQAEEEEAELAETAVVVTPARDEH